ncbi:MAG: thioredoxin family protein [Kiritimatiellaeota bacterium]|nr:thioredoxin family protein [Kiritimatiellota bacterium]
MKNCLPVVCAFLAASVAALLVGCRSTVPAGGGAAGIEAYLPLFQKNSLAGKVLYVTYSTRSESYRDGNVSVGPGKNVRLVFEAATGRHREETGRGLEQRDADARPGTTIYDHAVEINTWDGEEYVRWYPARHFVDAQGGYEYVSGIATVGTYSSALLFLRAWGHWGGCVPLSPLEERILAEDPRIEVDGDTVTIDDLHLSKFEFSKKNGILKRYTFFQPGWDMENQRELWEERYVDETYDFSNHVERAGVWMPLTITVNSPIRTVGMRNPDGEVKEMSMGHKMEYTVDPETLRLLDEAEDPSVFVADLPVGCHVEDTIRQEIYEVETAGQTLRGLPKAETLTEGAAQGAWTMDFDAAKKMAAEKKLPILLSVTGSDWCDEHRYMDWRVFHTRPWKDFAKQRLMLVIIDFPRNAGKVPAQFVKRNEQLAIQYGVTPIHFPTYIILAPDGETVLGKLKGSGNIGADTFIQQLEAITHGNKTVD